MTHEPVHLHKNKLNRDHNILLLLIPIIVFALTLVFLFSRQSVNTVADTSEPSVLGETSK